MLFLLKNTRTIAALFREQFLFDFFPGSIFINTNGKRIF